MEVVEGSDGAVAQANAQNKEARTKRMQTLKRELERVDGQLAEARAARQDAEEMEDPDLIAEFSAVEQRLEGLVAEIQGQISKLKQQSTGAAQALRERLKRFQMLESDVRHVLVSEADTPPSAESSASAGLAPKTDADLAESSGQLATAGPAAVLGPTSLGKHAGSDAGVSSAVQAPRLGEETPAAANGHAPEAAPLDAVTAPPGQAALHQAAPAAAAQHVGAADDSNTAAAETVKALSHAPQHGPQLPAAVNVMDVPAAGPEGSRARHPEAGALAASSSESAISSLSEAPSDLVASAAMAVTAAPPADAEEQSNHAVVEPSKHDVTAGGSPPASAAAPLSTPALDGIDPSRQPNIEPASGRHWPLPELPAILPWAPAKPVLGIGAAQQAGDDGSAEADATTAGEAGTPGGAQAARTPSGRARRSSEGNTPLARQSGSGQWEVFDASDTAPAFETVHSRRIDIQQDLHVGATGSPRAQRQSSDPFSALDSARWQGGAAFDSPTGTPDTLSASQRAEGPFGVPIGSGRSVGSQSAQEGTDLPHHRKSSSTGSATDVVQEGSAGKPDPQKRPSARRRPPQPPGPPAAAVAASAAAVAASTAAQALSAGAAPGTSTAAPAAVASQAESTAQHPQPSATTAAGAVGSEDPFEELATSSRRGTGDFDAPVPPTASQETPAGLFGTSRHAFSQPFAPAAVSEPLPHAGLFARQQLSASSGRTVSGNPFGPSTSGSMLTPVSGGAPASTNPFAASSAGLPVTMTQPQLGFLTPASSSFPPMDTQLSGPSMGSTNLAWADPAQHTSRAMPSMSMPGGSDDSAATPQLPSSQAQAATAGSLPTSPPHPESAASTFNYNTFFTPGSANSVHRLAESFKAASQGEAVGTPTSARASPRKGCIEVELWKPMTDTDREKCELAYHSKGYASIGGVERAEAAKLYARADVPRKFQHVWELSDLDGDQRLNQREFCLFMYLLKALRKGVDMPAYLIAEQVERLIGGGPATDPTQAQPASSQPHAAAAGATGSMPPAAAAASSAAMQPAPPFGGHVPSQLHAEQQMHPLASQASAGSAAPGYDAQSQSQAFQGTSAAELTPFGAQSARQASGAVGGPLTPRISGVDAPLTLASPRRPPPPEPTAAARSGVRSSAHPNAPHHQRSISAPDKQPRDANGTSRLARSVTQDQDFERNGAGAAQRREPFDELMSRGYPEENVKRALFLHGNDLGMANAWLVDRFGIPNTTPGAPTSGIPSPDTPLSPRSPGSPNGGGPPGTSPGTAAQPPSPLGSTQRASKQSSRGVRPTAVASGNDRLNITITSVDLQYRKALDRPFFTVSLRDPTGRPVEPPQDTPPAVFKRAEGVITAEHPIMLQTPVRQIPEGSLLYIEVKHYKTKEQKFSLRAWSFAPFEALVDITAVEPCVRIGPLDLSLYQKPIDTQPAAAARKLKRLAPSGYDLHINVDIAQ